MTKPHEETWRWDEAEKVIVRGERSADDDASPETWRVIVETDGGHYAPRTGERELIAQAPAMARLLLKLEWGTLDTCPSCGGLGVAIPDNPMTGSVAATGNRADCELVTVLRAAGVLP